VNAGKTLVMVTHDDALARRTTRTLHLADGLMDEPLHASPGESRA
jgi:predicted ABC-type transport system involved in lysophospholipase L1 biosynthesis ATPase subunit